MYTRLDLDTQELAEETFTTKEEACQFFADCEREKAENELDAADLAEYVKLPNMDILTMENYVIVTTPLIK